MSKINVKESYDLVMEAQEEFIRIRAGIERLILPLTQSYGLTPTQASVLNIIRKNERATISDIVKTLDFNQGNMSSMCKKLESDGFIKREKSPDDERKSFLTLTDKGTRAILGIDEFFSVEEGECWITPEDFEEAKAAVEILREASRKVNEKLSGLHTEEKNKKNA